MYRVVALAFSLIALCSVGVADESGKAAKPHLAYLVSDLRIPFWEIMWRGIQSRAEALGYEVSAFSADNSAKQELEGVVRAIREKVDGIIVSPTNSSACVTMLKLAKQADIPVVIADIGADSGEYVAYISSDNRGGAYQLGRILSAALIEKDWQQGRVGIIAIPQKRANGQARTAGFMQAMKEADIKGAGILQQQNFSYQETYDYAFRMLKETPDLRAIWLQGSDRYQAAIEAIAAAGRQGEVLLITFDAEPEFLQMIPEGKLVAAGMQQPFLMGEKAVEAMHAHLMGMAVEKVQKLPVLAISAENIGEMTPFIRRNALGMEK